MFGFFIIPEDAIALRNEQEQKGHLDLYVLAAQQA